MASVLENRYTRQPEMISEYAREVLARRVRMGALGGCVILAFIIIASIAHEDYITAAVIGICLVIPICAIATAPRLAERDLIGKEQRLHGGKTDYETVIRFGDSIVIEEDGYTLRAEYADVIAIYYLERSCVLMLSKTNGIQADVNGFTNGSMRQFSRMIEDRCKNAKVVRK